MSKHKGECNHRWTWLVTGPRCAKCFASLTHPEVSRRLNRDENRPRYRKVKDDVGFSVTGDRHLHYGVPVIDLYELIPKKGKP